jgi:hypothetical protein
VTFARLSATRLELLVGCVRTSPVPVHGTFRKVALEAVAEVVEDGKLVFAQDVGVGVRSEVVGNLRHRLFEVGGDVGVKIALSVAGNVNGALIGQFADAVVVGRVVVVVVDGAHGRGCGRYGKTKELAFRGRRGARGRFGIGGSRN